MKAIMTSGESGECGSGMVDHPALTDNFASVLSPCEQSFALLAGTQGLI